MHDVLISAAYGAAQIWWAELSIVLCMSLGFAVLRGTQAASPPKLIKRQTADEARATLLHSIEIQVAAGNNKAAIALWRAAKFYTPTPSTTLRAVAGALLKEEPESFADEVVDHMAMHEDQLGNPGVAAAVLDAPACVGNADATEELLQAIEERLDFSATPRMHDALLQGCALSGRPERVAESMARIRAAGQKVTARGHSLAIRGFVERGLLDAALDQAAEMRGQGLFVPRGAAAGLLALACREGRAAEVLDRAHREVGLTAEAAEVLLEHCSRSRNHCLAKRVARLTGAEQVPLSLTARTALISLCGGGSAASA
mmetsp:Transcript_5814/g.11651  ORF Transcript_5814/g.11651 Transcript_5814/m.11651 type:complete len:315 (-) Transcript_5814:135-1079(-)